MPPMTINDAVTVLKNGEGTLLAGRYRVVRQLGQGGMGLVWLAEDTQLDGKPFAIKMLPSILVANKRAYRQLKDEALVAMRLVHPNIVQIRAFEENDGNPFLVMDYVDGQTLDDYLAEYSNRVEHVERVGGGLPEADALRILRPIAAALDYAHGEGVVHRDVKPANVMIRNLRRDGLRVLEGRAAVRARADRISDPQQPAPAFGRARRPRRAACRFSHGRSREEARGPPLVLHGSAGRARLRRAV